MATKAKTGVELTKLNIQIASFRIRGTAPLIVHQFSEKAIKMIEDKQAKKEKKGYDVRDPQQEMNDSIYHISDGTGFPAVGFKAAMIRAGKGLGYVMTDLKGLLFVMGDEGGIVKIDGVPTLRTDMVRIGMGSADIRYRGEYKEWEATLNIKYNATNISVERIGQLINAAGFSCGIGEWRPEKSATGSFGTFELV